MSETSKQALNPCKDLNLVQHALEFHGTSADCDAPRGVARQRGGSCTKCGAQQYAQEDRQICSQLGQTTQICPNLAERFQIP